MAKQISFAPIEYNTRKAHRYWVNQLRFELDLLVQRAKYDAPGALPAGEANHLLELLGNIESTIEDGVSDEEAAQYGEDGLLSDAVMDAQDVY